jgi:hypothetical protein
MRTCLTLATGLFLLHSPLTAHASSTPTGGRIGKEYAFGVGINYFELKERALNNIVHSGPGFELMLTHERCTDSGIRLCEFSFTSSWALRSRYETEGSTVFFNPQFRYGYVHKATSFGPGLGLYLGGALNGGTNFQFFENWDDSHIYWLTAYDLSLTGAIRDIPIRSSRLDVWFDFPVMGVFSRSPNQITEKMFNPSKIHRIIHERMTFSGLPDHAAASMILHFHVRDPRRSRWKLLYRIDLVRNDMSSTLEHISLSQSFVLVWLFGRS